MDKQNVAYPHSGILFSLTKEGYTTTATWMNLEDIMLMKQALHQATSSLQFYLHEAPD